MTKHLKKSRLTDYLSCEINFNKDKSKAWIGQPHMTKKIKQMFGEEVQMQKDKTPVTPRKGRVKTKVEEDKLPLQQLSCYRTGERMLLFLMKHSRPDIANAVRELSNCLSGTTEQSYKEMLRITKYVLDTSTRGLKIIPKLSKGVWELVLYSNSNWAGDKDFVNSTKKLSDAQGDTLEKHLPTYATDEAELEL